VLVRPEDIHLAKDAEGDARSSGESSTATTRCCSCASTAGASCVRASGDRSRTSRPATAAAEEDPSFVGLLGFGEDETDALFWDGGYVGDAVTWHSLPISDSSGSQTCDDNSPCFSYTLTCCDDAAELRVGIDVPERVDQFRLHARPVRTARRLGASNPNQLQQRDALRTTPPRGRGR
jgi:hypothetical protein